MTKTSNHAGIPRPLNCFLIYRLEKQKEIVAKCAGANHRDISKIIAQWWKNATDEEKRPYREKSRLAKLEHSKLYPDYKYMPKKKTTPKRVYIRKNKKNEFTSRTSQNNELMKLMYRDRRVLEELEDDTGAEESERHRVKHDGNTSPHLTECVNNLSECSLSECLSDKLTPMLSPYPESFADQELASPMMTSQSSYFNPQDYFYNVLNAPRIDDSNAYNPEYLQFIDDEWTYMTYKPCMYATQASSSEVDGYPAYSVPMPNDHAYGLDFIDPSLLLM